MKQAIGIVGRKCGMTRIFDDRGNAQPVTLVEVGPNRITQVKTAAKDGYEALQVTAGSRRPIRINRPLTGHYAKARTEAGRGLWEFRLADKTDSVEGAAASNEGSNEGSFNVGDEIGLEQFRPGLIVDVTATSKGKGFAGTVKRWNFSTQDFSHGNSLSHRAGGSIGQCQTPGRVFKGKKMAGQMGNATVTTQNLEIVDVDHEIGVLLIKGAVPGPNGGDVMVKPAVKGGKRNAKLLAEIASADSAEAADSTNDAAAEESAEA